MPIIWLFIIYFFVKSNPWKKFIFFFSFTFLLITSLPIVSANLNKFFYSDGYKISNHEKNLSYVLIPTAGIYHDGHKSWHPTAESITRTQYGKKLAEEFSIPIIISGGEGKNRSFSSDKDIIRNKAAYLISEYFSYDFYHVDTKSMNTFQMAKNLKNSTKNFDGSILLATNPLHHKRTILTLEKQNFDVLIPNDYIKNTVDSYSIMPSVRGFNSFNKIIYEFLGLVWYYLTGKI
jgi:uncharacterized SAM-binding protein YcdF (DUF218 family)